MLPIKEKGFQTFKREVPSSLPVEERIKSFKEFVRSLPEDQIREQAYRCMNCGVPFCHSGCPLGNLIPDFNEAVKNGNWKEALLILHSTNNFPEFTGRACPAPCEAACVLAITDPAVTIEYLEREIADRGWREGWITPEPPETRTGKKIAVVGSGPSGLAAAQQLNRAGHTVVVFERDDAPGGLLMYGIPTFKLDKAMVNRRIDQIRQEGVEFRCGAPASVIPTPAGIEVARGVGKVVPAQETEAFDAVLLTMGSTASRVLDIPGHDLDGIHLAVPFLAQQSRRLLGKDVAEPAITARDKNVVVIGGGDTGSDCVGTCIRQGAREVWSLEILPKPPVGRDETMPWPQWPFILRTSSSHEEGGTREWSVLTKEFIGEEGKVKGLHCAHVEWVPNLVPKLNLGTRLGELNVGTNSARKMREIPGTDFTLDCGLVLLALGFLHPEHDTIVSDLSLELDPRGNIKTDTGFQTSQKNVFAAGDARRGQSLIVWAIHEGREAARCIDFALMGYSDLPSIRSYGYDTLGM